MNYKCYKALILDFDMTIADTSDIIITCLNHTATHFGYSAQPHEVICPYIGNIPEIMLANITGEGDMNKLAEMRCFYREYSRKVMPEMTSFFGGVVDGLERLNKVGIKVGILSLKLRELMLEPMRRDGLLPFVEQVVGYEDVESHKPMPEGIIKLAQIFGLPQEEILYVGDSLTDQQTAQNACVDFAPMLLGHTALEQFDSDYIVGSFNSFEALSNFILVGQKP